ncbi:MAG: RNA polymerase sigma factor [Planctomycetota bacterium]|jgi:RNA polymerase sigma factor (sigma-70 family)
MKVLEEALQRTLERGRAEYGPLPLSYEEFVAGVATVAPPPAAGGDLVRVLDHPWSGDLFLARACEARTPGAWEVVNQRFVPIVRSVLSRLGASADEAEEVARELPGYLLQPPRSGGAETLMGTYDGSGSLLAWLSSIARNRFYDRRRAESGPFAELSDVAGDDPPAFVVGVETGERLEKALKVALLDLSTRETFLLIWKFHNNLSGAEMARRLGVSEPRVSQLLRRTVAKIRASVLERIRDDSAPQWASRDELWPALRNVVIKLLSEREID